MKTLKKMLVICGLISVGISVVALIKKTDTVYDNKPKEKHPMQGKKIVFVENSEKPSNADEVCGHLDIIGITSHIPSFYEKYIKRCLDVIFSLGGLIILSPVLLILGLWIYIDNPGPILFTQKRVGKNKQFFKLHNVFKIEGDVGFCNKVLNNARLAI